MACTVQSFQFEATQQGWDELDSHEHGAVGVDFSLSGWKLGMEEQNEMGGLVRNSSTLSLDSDTSDTTDTSSSDGSSLGSPREVTPRGLRRAKPVVSLLRRTTSGKRKRAEVGDGVSACAKSPRARAGVRFSAETRVRACDLSLQAPSGACPFTDTRAKAKTADGPNHDSVLLDTLVVNYFESGHLETGRDVVELLGMQTVRSHGSALTARLECVCEQLDGVGKNVGLLPSNVRLGATHVPHLVSLLRLVVAAFDSAVGEPCDFAPESVIFTQCS